MDISKASNFERFVFDRVGRDGPRVKVLWERLQAHGEFELPRQDLGFTSGSSTHADRIATIRAVHERYGMVIDPHTADGVKVGLEHREPGVPMLCLETALPAKFAETIREALGRDPAPPAGSAGLENLPQRVEVIEADVDVVKRYIAGHA